MVHMRCYELAGLLFRKQEPALLAEASLIVWTIFVHPSHAYTRPARDASFGLHDLVRVSPMTICAFVSLLALLLPHVVSTWRYAVFVIYVKELAFLCFLALTLKPMDTDRPFNLGLISLLILGVFYSL